VDHNSDHRLGKRPLGADLIIPLATFGFSVYYITTVWSLPWQASAAGFGIVGALAVISVLLGRRFAKEYRTGVADFSFGDLFGDSALVTAQRLGLLALSIGFIFAMEYIGFTISLFVFVAATVVMLAGRERIGMALLLATSMSLGGYLLFIELVHARFPHGPFERLVGAIF